MWVPSIQITDDITKVPQFVTSLTTYPNYFCAQFVGFSFVASLVFRFVC